MALGGTRPQGEIELADVAAGAALAQCVREKIQAVVTGTPPQVAASLSRYIAAGARHLAVRLGALDLGSQRDQLEQVAALIPALPHQAESPVAL